MIQRPSQLVCDLYKTLIKAFKDAKLTQNHSNALYINILLYVLNKCYNVLKHNNHFMCPILESFTK